MLPFGSLNIIINQECLDKTYKITVNVHFCDLDPIGRCSSQKKRILEKKACFLFMNGKKC